MTSLLSFLAGAGDSAVTHSLQSVSGAYPASYSVRTQGSLLGHTADHSPPCGAKLKHEWSSNSTPPYSSMVHTGTTYCTSD